MSDIGKSHVSLGGIYSSVAIGVVYIMESC